MENLLTLEPGLIIWTFLTFGALLWILKRFAWKPLLNSLEKREERIHSDLQRSEHAREESEKLLAENRKAMTHAEVEARKIIDEARKMAEKVKSDIVASAEEQARQMLAQAKADLQREKITVFAELRNEVADLAIQAAGIILQERLDDERHRKLVDSFIAGLPKN